MNCYLVFNKEGIAVEVRVQDKLPTADEIQHDCIALSFDPVEGDTNPNNYRLVEGSVEHAPPKPTE